MHVKRTTKACSCNQCCKGKAIIIIIITYSESVFVALGIQHEMRMHHIVICDLQGLNIFPHSTI